MSEAIDETLLGLIELPESERTAALEKLCAEFPGRAADIRTRAALVLRWAAPATSIPGEDAPPFGDYELLEQIGGGGMGIVYRARQQRGGLQREVALKVLRGGQLLTSDARARFRREADAAMRLDDPAICPVLDVGEVAGTPYLAMRLVPGLSLAQRISQQRARGEGFSDVASAAARRTASTGNTPRPANAEATPTGTATAEAGDSTRSGFSDSARHELVARLIERTARALHGAHESGLVHRDIKPSNIMVTPSGDPVLLDFGLAHDEADPTLTRSGELLGTPAYMAPEQVRGMAATRAVDIYALGATLYECLSLRPPFEGQTRAALFEAIQRREPRALSGDGVSRALQTVVTTAMAKDPAHRYATAEDLAEDLARARSHRPLAAKPPGPARKLSLWTRRNPAAAVTIAVFAIATTLLALQASELRRARRRTLEEFHTARDVVQEMARIAIQELADTPRSAPVRTHMIEQALAHQERFLSTHTDLGELEDDVATARFQQALLLSYLDRIEESEQALEAALEARERRLAATSEGRTSERDRQRIELARVLSLQVVLSTERGATSDAITVGGNALRVLDGMPGPQAAEVRLLTRRRLAAAHKAADDLAAAIAELERARDELEAAPEPLAETNQPELAVEIAVALGSGLVETQRFDEALPTLEGAIRATDGPNPSFARRRLRAEAQRLLGILLRMQGRTEEAVRQTTAAADSFRSLAAENPRVPLFARHLVDAEIALGNALLQSDPSASRTRYEAARQATRAVLKQRPGADNATYQLALAEYGLGLVDRNDDPALALTHFEAALDALGSMPTSGKALELRSSAEHNASVMQNRLGNAEAAAALLAASIDTKRALYDEQPDRPDRGHDLANGLRVLGKSLVTNGEISAATAAFRESRQLAAQLAATHPSSVRFAVGLLQVGTSASAALAGKDRAGIELLDECLSWLEAIPDAQREQLRRDRRFVTAARRARMNGAIARSNAGDNDGARALLERILELDPRDDDARSFLSELER